MANSIDASQIPSSTALFTWFSPILSRVVFLTQNITLALSLPGRPLRLPVELWGRIFAYAASATHLMTRPSAATTSAFQTAIRITHVCRHWRKIALNCPEMWRQTFNLYMTRRQASEILSRVGSGNLQFVIPRGQRQQAEGQLWWPSATEVLQNMRHANLLWTAYNMSNVLDAVLTMEDAGFLIWSQIKKRLPVLDSLSLTLANISDPQIPWTGPGLRLEDPDLYDSSDAVTSGQPWRLRTLELMGCFFSLDPFYLQNLQEVWIASALMAESDLKTKTWLTTLSALPRLRSLALINSIKGSSIDECVGQDESDLEEEWQLISFEHQQWIFPSLQELVVISSPGNNHQLKSDCQEFLWHMRIPEDCVVSTFFDRRWNVTVGGA